jgi:hypothetical protein
MERREFINASGLALLSPFVAQALAMVESGSAGTPQPAPTVKDLFRLNRAYRADDAARVYKGEPIPEAGGPLLPPHMFMYYDEKKKLFLNPLNIVPTAKKQSWNIEATIHSFNISSQDYKDFEKLQKDIQIGLNFTAPTASQDRISWIFMNAINVFLAKAKDRPQQLSTFEKDNSPTADLKPSSKVTVSNGFVDLQVNAFGQAKDGIWRKLFNVLAKVAGSPLITSLGIPGLVAEAVSFVSQTLDVIASQDKLVPIWQTSPLTFAVCEGMDNERFKFTPGLWITIDRDYARKTNYLEKHTVNLEDESFKVSDKDQNAADANYLVMDLKLTAAKA